MLVYQRVAGFYQQNMAIPQAPGHFLSLTHEQLMILWNPTLSRNWTIAYLTLKRLVQHLRYIPLGAVVAWFELSRRGQHCPVSGSLWLLYVAFRWVKAWLDVQVEVATQIRSQLGLEDRYCHQSGKFWWALGGFELQGARFVGLQRKVHMADPAFDVAGSWRQHGDHLWDTRAGFCCTIQHLIICNLARPYRISLITFTSLACKLWWALVSRKAYRCRPMSQVCWIWNISGRDVCRRWSWDISLPFKHMGVSENSVPLNPMVNDHYPY